MVQMKEELKREAATKGYELGARRHAGETARLHESGPDERFSDFGGGWVRGRARGEKVAEGQGYGGALTSTPDERP